MLREPARRIGVSAWTTLKDLLRRRLTVVLLFAVPAIFHLVVVATTGHRATSVTLGTLVEEGAEIAAPERPRPFAEVFDDGFRTLDQRSLSLVFLAHTAVCFLSCFLAFYLVYKRRELDGRLVLAGYRPHELLLGKVLALGVISLLLALYETSILCWAMPLRQPTQATLGLLEGGFTYGCIGLFFGAVAVHELEGIFLIVLLANVDVGWLQNPIYYAVSQHRGIIEALPGYQSTQLTIVSALTDDLPLSSSARALAWAVSALALALGAFGLRIRRPRQEATALAHERRRYLKILLIVYAIWFATFELVGRIAERLPTHDISSALDRAIPVVPLLIWPYEACYLFPFISLSVIRDFHRVNRAILAIIIASAIAYIVYLAFPVAFPRPQLGSSLAETILATEYAADFSPGANKLPSLHVAISWILACAMHKQSKRRAIESATWLLVLAITVSTVLVKQHLVVDAISGALLGIGAFQAASQLYSRAVDAGAEPEVGLWQMLSPARLLSRGPARSRAD